ncbi:MAG TPA: NlpC/P60 family protein [Azospirillum sp.]|nr:NlpC/P60 family protein [Azospirillum sp.]
MFDGLDGRDTNTRERIVTLARSYLGVPYRWGGRTRRGMDGTGFVSVVYAAALPHRRARFMALDAESLMDSGLFEPVAEPLPGDLVLFPQDRHTPNHVAIVVDGDGFIGAQSATGVALASYRRGWWAERPVRLFRRCADLA